MRLLGFVCLLFCLALSPSTTVARAPAQVQPGVSPGELIVRLRTDRHKPAVADALAWGILAERFGLVEARPVFTGGSNAASRPAVLSGAILQTGARTVRPDDLAGILLLKLDPGIDVAAAAREYSALETVEYSTPNFLRHPLAVPSDPRYADQSNLKRIEWQSAWEQSDLSRHPIVAIVDTGVDYLHEDLAANIWTNRQEERGSAGVDDDENGYVDDVRGWDFADAPTVAGTGDYRDQDNDPMDESGHGTHVAGIAGAVANNGLGIVGVAPQCRLMALRAGFQTPGGAFLEDDDIAQAILYAVDNGADVINMSWGDPRPSPLIRDVIRYAHDRGVTLVAAAGNEGQASLFYPAALGETIAVGAAGDGGSRAQFSNFGLALDLLAPGVGILGTLAGGGYTALSGTSMAAPHVSGVAALVKSRHPEWSPEQVRGAVLASASGGVPGQWSLESGAGILNAARAVGKTDPLMARIRAPSEATGADSSIEVLANVAGGNATTYLLLWGVGVDPVVWNQLASGKAPRDGTISCIWRVSSLQEGNYVVRLVVSSGEALMTERAEDRLSIVVDHSQAVVGNVKITQRLDGARVVPFVEWTTDDRSIGRVEWRDKRSAMAPSLLQTDSEGTSHMVELPGDLAAGDYELEIICLNSAGLSTRAGPLLLTVSGEQVKSIAYTRIASLPDGVLLPVLPDFDGDGRPEVCLMPYSGDGPASGPYNVVAMFEMQDTGQFEKEFTSGNLFLPWSTGDINADGKVELAGVDFERVRLFAPKDRMSFPTEKIWEFQKLWGGEIADTDADGNSEIIARSASDKALVIYEYTSDHTFAKTAELGNATTGTNEIGPRFVVSDVDGDGRAEVIYGDGDGDLVAYEATGDDAYGMLWTERLPEGGDARLVGGGSDLDGDGREEFAVAEAVSDEYDMRKNRWILRVYQATGDNRYSVEWETEVVGMQSAGNGIVAGGAIGDGIQALVVCLVPNLYVFTADRTGHYRPVWHTAVGTMYQPVVGDLDRDGLPEILFSESGRICVAERDPGLDGLSPDTTASQPRVPPRLVSAEALSDHEVALVFSQAMGPSARNPLAYVVEPGDHLPSSAVLDRGGLRVLLSLQRPLTTGQGYAVTASGVADTLGSELSPSGGSISFTVPGPGSPLRVVRAVAVSEVEVVVTFDGPLATSPPSVRSYAVRRDIAVGSAAVVIASVTLDEDDPGTVHVRLDPSTPVKASGVGYELVVDGAMDSQGRAIRSMSSVRISVATLANVSVFPNPFSAGLSPFLTFGAITPHSEVLIYASDGVLVRRLREDDGTARARWDGSNEDGRPVAPGIYIYRVGDGRGSVLGKVAVLR